MEAEAVSASLADDDEGDGAAIAATSLRRETASLAACLSRRDDQNCSALPGAATTRSPGQERSGHSAAVGDAASNGSTMLRLLEGEEEQEEPATAARGLSPCTEASTSTVARLTFRMVLSACESTHDPSKLELESLTASIEVMVPPRRGRNPRAPDAVAPPATEAAHAASRHQAKTPSFPPESSSSPSGEKHSARTAEECQWRVSGGRSLEVGGGGRCGRPACLLFAPPPPPAPCCSAVAVAAAAAAAASAAARPLHTVILPDASPTASLSSSPSTAAALNALDPEIVSGLRSEGAPARQAHRVRFSTAATTPPPAESTSLPPAAESLNLSGSSWPDESLRRMMRPAVPPAQEVER